MIKNDRQYRITRAQAERFQAALGDVSKQSDIHPAIQQAQQASVRSQLAELEQDLLVYENLKAGLVRDFRVESLSDFPSILIQARIARGLTQKGLAEKLGLKEQQIQRYEASDYASANMSRLQEVANALDVGFEEDLVLNLHDDAPKRLFADLKAVGVDKRFTLTRLLPQSLAARLAHEADEEPSDIEVVQAGSVLSRIFQWSPSELFGDSPLRLDPAIAGQTRFKMAARVHEGRMVAYTSYAWFLASTVAKTCSGLSTEPVPSDWREVRRAILDHSGEISFQAAVRYVWSLGVIVLPLVDPGVFDAACWRISGRNVIVLKQSVRSQARWLFDLLHELRHLADKPDEPWLSLIEFENSVLERREMPEEEEAHEFAGNIVLEGRSEELTAVCVERARGSVPRLKSAVQEVAASENVPVDVLANYVAFRLSLQGINWWGAATNLQVPGSDPLEIARDELLHHADLNLLDDVERDIVTQALREVEQ